MRNQWLAGRCCLAQASRPSPRRLRSGPRRRSRSSPTCCRRHSRRTASWPAAASSGWTRPFARCLAASRSRSRSSRSHVRRRARLARRQRPPRSRPPRSRPPRSPRRPRRPSRPRRRCHPDDHREEDDHHVDLDGRHNADHVPHHRKHQHRGRRHRERRHRELTCSDFAAIRSPSAAPDSDGCADRDQAGPD